MDTIDYNPIFNKMTRETFDKFLEKYKFPCKKGDTKKEYQDRLLELFDTDLFARNSFHDFYKQLEEAGRKHYFLFKFDSRKITKDEIENKLKIYNDEEKRTFNPVADDGKTYYKKEGDVYIFKHFQIKKSFIFTGDKENPEETLLTKEYKIIKIHFVTFVRIDFKKNIIVCGYDACGDLSDKQKQTEELFKFLETIIGDINKTESALTSEIIDDLLVLPNCLSYSIVNIAKINDIGKFKKGKADYERIKRDLKSGLYTLDEIKEKNPDFDLGTNVLYNAGREASYDSDFSLKNDNIEFYYFTDVADLISCFRIRFDVEDSSIVTYSDSITKEELWDVFGKII